MSGGLFVERSVRRKKISGDRGLLGDYAPEEWHGEAGDRADGGARVNEIVAVLRERGIDAALLERALHEKHRQVVVELLQPGLFTKHS